MFRRRGSVRQQQENDHHELHPESKVNETTTYLQFIHMWMSLKHLLVPFLTNTYVHFDSQVNELKAALGPLSGHNLLYCTDACLKRYLEARNWNIEKAKKMLEDTLQWRSTFKPHEIHWHQISGEGETGKVFRANFRDRFGRTVLIMKPGRQVII